MSQMSQGSDASDDMIVGRSTTANAKTLHYQPSDESQSLSLPPPRGRVFNQELRVRRHKQELIHATETPSPERVHYRQRGKGRSRSRLPDQLAPSPLVKSQTRTSGSSRGRLPDKPVPSPRDKDNGDRRRGERERELDDYDGEPIRRPSSGSRSARQINRDGSRRAESAPPPCKVCTVCEEEILPGEKPYKWYNEHHDCGNAKRSALRRLGKDGMLEYVLISS